jgi:transglutaminase-like putative cysteine protease
MSRTDHTVASTERLLWTAAVVGGASAPHWPTLPVWIPLLLCACILWRLAARALHWPLPNRIFRLVLAFIAFVGVLMEYATINGVEAGSALLIVMVALKFLESRTHRDQIVLIIIAYFLVFASLLSDRSLLIAAYLVGFVWITTVGLLQLGRRGSLLPSWPTTKFGARLLLQSMPIMIVLFLLFPRLPGPLWAIPGSTSSGATGLDEEMRPGDITNLGLSDAVAFRAEFFTAAPPADRLYWRGPVLADLNGTTWFRAPGMRRRVINTLEVAGEPTEYRVMLEPTGQSWAFALDMPHTWSASDRRNISMGSDYQLRVFAPVAFDTRVDYTVVSYTDYTAHEALTPAEQERFTRLPVGSNPRTRALVAEWLAEDPTPDAIIARALDVFRAEEFYYTLTPPPLGRHTADEFIFETREGFCEHYASAFAIMMRAAGLPTRIVTGYQGGELNGIGNYYIIRQMDAHAWTEVWLGERGWVRVDPTAAVAPERIALGSVRSGLSRQATGTRALTQMRWLRQAALAWDAANTYWNEWVVGYGPQLQRSLLRRLGFERLRWPALLTLAAIGTAVLLAGLTLYLRWAFRRHRHVDSAAHSFAEFARKLTKASVAPLQPGEGPRAYAQRAQHRLPQATDDIERIVHAYLAARYEPDDGAALLELMQRVKQFRPRYCAPESHGTRRRASALRSN